MRGLKFNATFLSARTESYNIFKDFTDTLKLEIHFKILKDTVPTYRKNYKDQPVETV